MFTALQEYMLASLVSCPRSSQKSRGGKGGGNMCEVKLSADGVFRRVAGLEVIVLDDLPETE
jgi:hypothetical protein